MPWTVGQRKWISEKIKRDIAEAFRQREFFVAENNPDMMIMSAAVYKAFQMTHSQPTLDKVICRLSEKGVLYVTEENGVVLFEGMGNKRWATLTIPSLDYEPTPDQAVELYDQWLNDVESQIRSNANRDT